MRKIVLLIIGLGLFAMQINAASVRQDIKKICSFSFPAAPQVGTIAGWTDYLYQTDSCRYLVEVRPLSKPGVIVDTVSLKAFYEGMVNSIIKGYNATLIGKKPISVKGLRAYEVEYIKKNTAPNIESACTRMILMGNEVVKYTFAAPYKDFISYAALKDTFFESFALYKGERITGKIDSAALAHDTTPTPKYDSVVTAIKGVNNNANSLLRPGTLQFVISFVASIALLAGLLYILVRWRKNKTANK